MKTLIALFALFASTYSQIIRTTTQTDTTSLTNSIKPFTDIFTCPCDYIANSCDIYCCCDTECLDSTITSWTDLDLCTSWEDTGSLFQKCPDESILSSLVNPSTQETVGIQQFSTIFCIDYEMVPYAGYFFVENNGTTSGSVLIHGSTTTTTSDTAYSSEQNLYSTLTGTTTVLSRFTIPKANPFGMCENTFSARYLIDLPTSSCTRQVTLSTDCSASSVLSTTYYTTTLISAYPAESASSITITQGNIIRTNGAAPGTSTIAYTDLTTSCRCDNAVAAVEYYVTYSTDNKITAVRADFTLQSIVSTDCSVTTALDQSFAVYYQTVSGTTAAIPRSGNPGYIVGLPLLVGNNQTTFIQRLIGGFRIRGISTTGECTTPSADYTAYREDTIPKFGMNSSLTCYLAVTSTTLSNICTATYISTNIMLFQNFGTDKSVGLFGSSDIKYISDWIQIEQPTVALSSYPVQLSGTTSCSVPDEEIYIFYAEYGLSSNPQNYIVKVARRYNINRTFNLATSSYLQFTQTIKYIKISSADLLQSSS